MTHGRPKHVSLQTHIFMVPLGPRFVLRTSWMPLAPEILMARACCALATSALGFNVLIAAIAERRGLRVLSRRARFQHCARTASPARPLRLFTPDQVFFLSSWLCLAIDGIAFFLAVIFRFTISFLRLLS